MRRRAAILGVALVIASVWAGSARSAPTASVPSGAVASVGDSVVTRASFEHWFEIAARDAKGPRRLARDYRPPTFGGCVTKARKAQRTSRRRATTPQLRKHCRQTFESLRGQALRFLILERWVAAESSELGIALTAGEREEAFRQARERSFSGDSEFRRFLKRSGMTVADARFQVEFDELYGRLREHAVATSVAPVTDLEVATYYERHLADFRLPELRDARIVLARTRSAATAARRALERGQTWRHVARKYSIDRATRHRGGKVIQVARGTLDEALGDALFRAPRGRLRGPVKGQFGYFVFKVLKIAPAVEDTLEEASPAIRERLRQERRAVAADAFEDALHAKWQARTTCRSGYVISMCANRRGPAPAGAS